jgi:hypothetical protein
VKSAVTPSRRWRLRALSSIVLAGVVVSGCGSRFYRPPDGAGLPATDGAAALADASKHCGAVATFQAAMRLSGRGLPNLNVQTGVTSAGQLLLRVGATAAPDIWLAGTADRATLLLREDNRVVRARAEEIVDALIGTRLDPEQFLAMLTGCLARDRSITTATSYEQTRRITTPDATLFLEQTKGAWRIVAGTFGNTRVDYRPLTSSFPTRVRVRTTLVDGREMGFTLDVQESIPDKPIEDRYFELEVPSGAVPMSVDELRQRFSGR